MNAINEPTKSTTTLDYYNKNAKKFISGTISVDFGIVQNRFLDKLHPGAEILDYGCGSGRDTKHFLEQGCKVTAIDGSQELCKLASEYTGILVKHMLFQDLDEKEAYDGIWACSSILHVPANELRDIIKKMANALRAHGIIYTSFKYGTFEGERNGRYFTDMTEETFAKLIQDMDELEIEEQWITSDAIAITIGFVCTVIFGKMWSAPDKNKNDKKNDTKENDTTKAVITEEPGAVYAAAEGTVKDIEASTDPTFANKVLGDGVVIFPEDGTVMAPCKATVSLVYPTGHAIGLTTADGAEILIHCGVDTVNMNGEGFETLVKEGQEVTAEEALIRFDIDLVKKHGYSPEILVIFTELPEGKTIKTEEKHIAKNDKMAEIV